MENNVKNLVANIDENPEILRNGIRDVDIDYLIRKAEDIDRRSHDFKVYPRDIQVMEDLSLRLHWNDMDNQEFPLTSHSFSQLCSKLGVPMNYAKKLLNIDKQDLLVHNLNELFDKHENPFLIRTTDSEIRAVLSHKYTILDSPSILKISKELIPQDEYHVVESFISPERLHVRFLGNRIDIPDQDLFIGIQLDSSDVGRKNLSVDYFLYKQVCTNGMKVIKLNSNIFRKVHMGNTIHTFYNEFSKGMSAIDDLVADLKRNITTAIETPLTDFRFRQAMTKVRASFDLTQKDEEIREMVKPYGQNMFGVINAITEIAQKYTLDKRIQLEEIAGELLLVA